jgi:hypothetical protein
VGAWGAGPFSNDDALDWIADFEESGVPAIVQAFDPTEAQYLEAPEGSRIIAAAEVVAAAFGHPSSEFPETLRAPVMSTRDAIVRLGEIRENALRAVDRVLGDASELKELWQDTDESYDAWLQSVRDLRGRLRQQGS